MPIYIPPNGFQGFAQQTAAVQRMGSRGGTGTRRRTRRSKKRSASAAPRKKKRRAAAGKKARLVKGSAAAKRYMAKIRAKRKK